MNIVKISADAYAYYSGAEYHETFYLTEEFYDQIKDSVSEQSFFIAELDGKHSQTECSISAELLTEDAIAEIDLCDINTDGDGSTIYEEFKYICEDAELDIVENIRVAIGYMKLKAKPTVKVTYLIPEKCKKELDSYVEYLLINNKMG